MYSLSEIGTIYLSSVPWKIHRGALFYVPAGTEVSINAQNHIEMTFALISFSLVKDCNLKKAFSSPLSFGTLAKPEPDYYVEGLGKIPQYMDIRLFKIEPIIISMSTSGALYSTVENFENAEKIYQAKGYFNLLLAKVWRYMVSSIKNKPETCSPIFSSSGQIVEKGIEFIEMNLSRRNLTLNEIARASGSLSPVYFGMIFKKMAGKTPFEYILERRVEKAQIMLKKNWDMRVNEIAEHCGFNNLSHFFKVFKRYTGFSPKEFRRNENTF